MTGQYRKISSAKILNGSFCESSIDSIFRTMCIEFNNECFLGNNVVLSLNNKVSMFIGKGPLVFKGLYVDKYGVIGDRCSG